MKLHEITSDDYETKLDNDYVSLIKNAFDDYENRFGGITDTSEVYLDSLGDGKMKKLPIPLPETIIGTVHLFSNSLTSFENFPNRVLGTYGLDISDNRFTSLKDIHKYIHEVTGEEGINLNRNPIKSNVLGLLLIKGLKVVYMSWNDKNKKLKKVEIIINKHLGKGRAGVLAAQAELIEAGFEEYAKI